MKKWTTMAVIAALAAGSAQAAIVAYDDFDYGTGVNLTLDTKNNGIGWANDWNTSLGGGGLTTSGLNQSLYFNQSPALITGGGTHVWSESVKGNERDWTTAIDLATETMYFSMLFRTYGTGAGAVVDMRAEFFDGASATGNMRGNVGISNGSLFTDGNTGGYLQGNVANGLVADDTTYLLVMRRDSTAIRASLITADGNASSLASEPGVWQVNDGVATGVDLTSMRLIMAGSAGFGIRADEVRIATDWDSVVDGIVIPEPATLGLLGLAGLGAFAVRRFKMG